MYLTTHSGKQVDPANLRVAEVNILDIAHSLSHQCRFAGHTSTFYSVAQHSLRVAERLPRPHRLVGLLHDAPEAYLTDLPRPLKLALPQYTVLEDKVWATIAEAFKINVKIPTEVLWADNQALKTEWRELMNAPLPDGLKVYSSLPSEAPMRPEEAKREFLRLFYELTDQE